MIRKILKLLGLALYSDYERALDHESNKFQRMLAAREYIKRQRSDENGVVYLSDDEQYVLHYILFNGNDDTTDADQRIENAEDFVEAHK